MLPLAEALAVHQAVTAELGLPEQPVDHEALARVMARAYAQRDGVPLYPALLGKVAVTICAVAADGPFGELNTAMALALAAVALSDAGYELRVESDEAATFMHAVALGFTSWHRVTLWLKGRAVRMHSSYDGVQTEQT